MRKSILLFGVLAACISCSDDSDSKEARMRINHYQQPIVPGWEGPDMLTYIVQEGASIGTDDWHYMGQNILAFDYELGSTYDVIVTKKKNDPDLIDAPPYTYSLKKVVSKQKVADNTPFEVRLAIYYDANEYIKSFVTEDGQAEFKLLGKTPIDCGDLCISLSDKLDEPKTLYGTFIHQGGALKLTALRQE
jgi:hypothetical protein